MNDRLRVFCDHRQVGEHDPLARVEVVPDPDGREHLVVHEPGLAPTRYEHGAWQAAGVGIACGGISGHDACPVCTGARA